MKQLELTLLQVKTGDMFVKSFKDYHIIALILSVGKIEFESNRVYVEAFIIDSLKKGVSYRFIKSDMAVNNDMIAYFGNWVHVKL